MAKLSGPLLSFGARGAIGKTVVASKWRGVPYLRQHVVPANPKTTAQMAIRTLFAFLREAYKLAPGNVTSAWEAFAQGRPFTGMNKFVGENVRVLKGDADLNDIIFCPGAKGGLAPLAFTASTGSGSGEIDCDVTVPNEPTGWTLLSAEFVAMKDQDPTGIFDQSWASGTETVAPWDHTLTGLEAGESYQVGCFLTWEKPNGVTAYSVSLSDTATSGA